MAQVPKVVDIKQPEKYPDVRIGVSFGLGKEAMMEMLPGADLRVFDTQVGAHTAKKIRVEAFRTGFPGHQSWGGSESLFGTRARVGFGGDALEPVVDELTTSKT